MFDFCQHRAVRRVRVRAGIRAPPASDTTHDPADSTQKPGVRSPASADVNGASRPVRVRA
jgi:hypothetical protein